jgi:hypothetical protein
LLYSHRAESDIAAPAQAGMQQCLESFHRAIEEHGNAGAYCYGGNQMFTNTIFQGLKRENSFIACHLKFRVCDQGVRVTIAQGPIAVACKNRVR